ncbi:MAG: DUF805 domain-containing protein [Methylocystaceae bacterium]|nr:DUF805 domain-containing protein [Methylocystaceae bacterium]
MHSVQLAVKRLYRIGDFTNNSGRAEFWLYYLFYSIIDLSLDYITSNVLKGQKTNMLYIAETGFIWGLEFYLFLGLLSAILARLKDAGFAKWVGRLYILWNIFSVFLNAVMKHSVESANTSGALTLSVIIIIIFILLCIPLLMPTAKSEEGPDGDWQSGVSQISKFVSRKINQGDGFRVFLCQ